MPREEALKLDPEATVVERSTEVRQRPTTPTCARRLARVSASTALRVRNSNSCMRAHCLRFAGAGDGGGGTDTHLRSRANY